jgi:hypothetical protein
MIESHTYSLGKRRTIYALAAACFLPSLFFPLTDWLFSYRNMESGAWYFCLMFGFFGIISFFWAKKARLIITDRGLECHDYDLTSFQDVFIEWGVIKSISIEKYYLLAVLVSPGLPLSGIYRWLSRFWGNPLVLNLSSFIDHWNDEGLIKDFQTYRPDLFVNDPENIE